MVTRRPCSVVVTISAVPTLLAACTILDWILMEYHYLLTWLMFRNRRSLFKSSGGFKYRMSDYVIPLVNNKVASWSRSFIPRF
ncbi:hypothetical protein F4801DRAFT_548193 [Xylaria longipes]|nr:hypothetical protein F4801DRAFT_548193 [Xylaria longipes]